MSLQQLHRASATPHLESHVKVIHWVSLGILLFLDQLTKWLAVRYLDFFQPTVVIKDILSLPLVYNYGAAYGILQHQRVLLLTISLLVGGCLLIFHKKIVSSRWSAWGWVFLLVGTCGNSLDRLTLGYVVDFININIFPVFNLADMCIDLGIFLFLFEMIFTSKPGSNEMRGTAARARQNRDRKTQTRRFRLPQ